MTKKQTIAVARLYDERLAAHLRVATMRMPSEEMAKLYPLEDPSFVDGEHSLTFSACSHLRWMTGEIIQFAEAGDGERDKASRWLGFMQGVLWRSGLYTLDELREHNRSPGAKKS